MTVKTKATSKEPVARCPPPPAFEKHSPQLNHLAGSKYDDWNTLVANQAMNSAWYPSKMDAEQRRKMQFGLLCFLSGVEPKDELEGMLASQLLASHNAAMECYRRAMVPEQTFEGRRENLSQASKLSRTHTTLLEALNRHRGKGQQKVTVEHVHVHEGGQALSATWRGEADQIGESTPCTWICTGRNVAEHELGVRSRASRQPWQTVGAECMAARHRERRKAIEMRSSTVATPRRRLPDVARFRHSSASPAT
jgi:hypothetical protein